MDLVAGFRYNRRTDRADHRFFVGGFLYPEFMGSGDKPGKLDYRTVIQFGYQYDVDRQGVEGLIDSESIRLVAMPTWPQSESVTSFLVAGVLATWNEENNLSIDKIRLGPDSAFH